MRSFIMPILLPNSSFKTNVAVVITGVFSVAAAVSFTVPSVSHIAVSCFPTIYDNTVFLLKPPYLYLVINCIIVSIAATSNFTQKTEIPEVVTPVTVVEVPEPSDIDTGYLNVAHDVDSDYTGFVEKDDVRDGDATVTMTVDDDQKFPEVIAGDKLTLDDAEDQQTDKPNPSSDSLEPEKPKPKNDSPGISIQKLTKKPPRFNQHKSLKIKSEAGGGNKKSALGVSKPPRRQDTLETTWKKITEGRSTPLTKHLTKSDTWQERTHVSSEKSAKEKEEKMTKSDNLSDINAQTKEETNQTRLKREPSAGQEELNRRVEAFIKKFNEDMRLQRLESLAKFNKMVN